MNRTPIEWTHWSANALKLELPDGTRVNACVKISEGCRSSYAESIVRRFWRKAWGKFPGYSAALLRLGKPVLVEEELQAVLRLNQRIAGGKADPTINRVFWHDMTDEFLSFWPDEMLDRIWAVRALTTNLIHQVLTKRPDRAAEYTLALVNGNRKLGDALSPLGCDGLAGRLGILSAFGVQWGGGEAQARTPWRPFPNVWLGTSCENQQTADERIPHLLRCPAAVRFLSCEPLLGPVTLPPLWRHHWSWDAKFKTPEAALAAGSFAERKPQALGNPSWSLISWVIIGGESGPGARPFQVQWARDIIAQCKAAGVACFLKQMGANVRDRNDAGFEGDTPSAWPMDTGAEDNPNGHREEWQGSPVRVRLKDKKGGNMEEWPADLRVRQWPKALQTT